MSSTDVKTYKKITLEEEYEKNKELSKNDLDTLKQWYSKQPHLPAISDEFLVQFFHSCNFDMEFTKNTIDNYFTMRTHVADFFKNRNPFVVNVKDGKPVVYFTVLSKTSPEGYKIVLIKFANTDPQAFDHGEMCKAFIMHQDIDSLLQGTCAGVVFVIDMEGTRFGHVGRLNVVHIKNILYYLQEAMPVRLKGVHYINAVQFMDVILGMMKPFIMKQLKDMLHVHSQGMESFYKFIPEELLPKNYGGKDLTIEELYEKSLKSLQDHKTWFEEESKLRVDESKRMGKSKSEGLFGAEGSFKQLNLD